MMLIKQKINLLVGVKKKMVLEERSSGLRRQREVGDHLRLWLVVCSFVVCELDGHSQDVLACFRVAYDH